MAANASCFYLSNKTKDSVSLIAGSNSYSGHINTAVIPQSLKPIVGHNISKSAFGIPRAVLLHHVQQILPDMQLIRPVDAIPLLSLSMNHPYLLDALLAFASYHLGEHIQQQQTSPSSYRVAQYFQQGLAIRGLKTALLQSVDLQEVDAMVFTSMLLNVLSFAWCKDDESWVFSNDPSRLDWISICFGLKAVLMATVDIRKTSTYPWGHRPLTAQENIFLGSYGGGVFLVNVPMAWIMIFNLDSEQKEESIFYEPVRILAETRLLEPRSDALYLHTSFFSKLDKRFHNLVQFGDERAMWLMGYWMGLLCRLNCWWMLKRVRKQYLEIRAWLLICGVTDRVGNEGRMWIELMKDYDEADVWISGFTGSNEASILR